MSGALAIFLILFISVSHSATQPICEKLVGPLEHLVPGHLEGTWAFVAGSLNHRPSMEALRLRDSITMYFSNTSETSTLSYTQINRFGDQCQSLPYNISVEGSTFTFNVRGRFNLTGSFTYTSCPDCVVMRWIVQSKRRVSNDLYLLSRRRQLEPQEMEEFRAQLWCLQLPSPVVMDPTMELCSEQMESRLTATAAAGEED